MSETKIIFTYSINPFGPSNEGTVSNMLETLDGVTKHSHNFTCSTHGHAFPNAFDGSLDIEHIIKIVVTTTAFCGVGDTVRLRLTFDDSVTGVEFKETLFPGTGTHTLTFVWKPRIIDAGPPTYLEELHKLDNYSNPQYIPNIL